MNGLKWANRKLTHLESWNSESTTKKNHFAIHSLIKKCAFSELTLKLIFDVKMELRVIFQNLNSAANSKDLFITQTTKSLQMFCLFLFEKKNNFRGCYKMKYMNLVFRFGKKQVLQLTIKQDYKPSMHWSFSEHFHGT